MKIPQTFPESFGFVIGGNLSSPYCLISPLRNKHILDYLKDYAGFILLINDKHLLAGLPEESIIGTTVRRLSVCLSRSPNVRKIYCIKSDKHLNGIYDILCKLNKIEDPILEKICHIGRMNSYNIRFREVKELINRIDFIEQYTIPNDNGQSLIKILSQALLQVDKIKLPEQTKFFKWQPKYDIDMRFETNDRPSFTNIETVQKYTQWKLLNFGKIGKDRNDLCRIQLNYEFGFEFKNYTIEKIEQFLEKNYTIYNNSLQIYDKNVCNEGSFCERIRRCPSNDIDKYSEFISELIKALNNDQLCYSKVLYFVTNLDGGYDQTQIGWESITPYLSRDDEGYVLSLKHNLRSVDLYDGFPFNLYFCVKISEDIIKVLKKEKSNIRLGSIYINIANLHAYVDCIPETIYKKHIKF